MIEAAQKQADKRGRDVMTRDGERLRAGWNCPFDKAHKPGAPLSAAHAAAVKGVGQLVGGTLPAHCPCVISRTPAAHKLVGLHRWLEKGQLHLRVAHPSQVLVDALDAFADGISARESFEMEQIEQRAKQQAEEYQRKAGPRGR